MSLPFWSNLLGYQLVWFITVAGAGRGSPWPGTAAAIVFVVWQLAVSSRRRLDLQLAVVAVLLGAALDGGLASFGLLRYAAPVPALPPGYAPVWILALWAAFSMTLNHSLAWLKRRLLAAIVFGAVGGPLAYAGAARGWNAVEFVPPQWRAICALAIGWGTAMALFIALINRQSDHAPRIEAPARARAVL